MQGLSQANTRSESSLGNRTHTRWLPTLVPVVTKQVNTQQEAPLLGKITTLIARLERLNCVLVSVISQPTPSKTIKKCFWNATKLQEAPRLSLPPRRPAKEGRKDCDELA